MGTYFLGSSIHMRGLYWNRALVATPSPATGFFATNIPHGMTDGQTVAMLNGALGGLGDRDGLGQYQIYYVVNSTTSTFQLAFTAAGSPIPLTSSAPGVIVALSAPTSPVVIVTTFDGAQRQYTPTIEGAGTIGVYVLDYQTTQRGPSQTYEFDGGGGVVSAGKGTFNVV